jgi:hypothetical protein
MTILELLSLHLSVDGLVKAIACNQLFKKHYRQTLERHRAPQGKAAMNVPLLGSNGSYWRILLKKAKIERLRKSREGRFLDASIAARPVGPIRRSVVVFVGIDVVPHVAARETHRRS